MDPIMLIDKYYAGHPVARQLLLSHSEAVAGLALWVGRALGLRQPDLQFISEASMLHDIGIVLTDAPVLGCSGESPYICHGVLGAGMLMGEGLPRHARVCECHVGIGLTGDDIRRNGFALPERDMVPESVEEQIVCYADKFFSKNTGRIERRPVDEVRAMVAGYGEEKLRVFDGWMKRFGLP